MQLTHVTKYTSCPKSLVMKEKAIKPWVTQLSDALPPNIESTIITHIESTIITQTDLDSGVPKLKCIN